MKFELLQITALLKSHISGIHSMFVLYIMYRGMLKTAQNKSINKQRFRRLICHANYWCKAHSQLECRSWL